MMKRVTDAGRADGAPFAGWKWRANTVRGHVLVALARKHGKSHEANAALFAKRRALLRQGCSWGRMARICWALTGSLPACFYSPANEEGANISSRLHSRLQPNRHSTQHTSAPPAPPAPPVSPPPLKCAVTRRAATSATRRCCWAWAARWACRRPSCRRRWGEAAHLLLLPCCLPLAACRWKHPGLPCWHPHLSTASLYQPHNCPARSDGELSPDLVAEVKRDDGTAKTQLHVTGGEPSLSPP